jgi:small ligand-binding sensory domain FIST
MGGMARFGAGIAVDLDLVRAAEAAVEQALDPLSGRTPDLVCVFVCGDDPDQTAAALERAASLSGAATTIGCTAGGVIGPGQAVEVTPAVSVWAGVLPGARLRGFHLEVLRTSEALAVVGMPEPDEPPDTAAILLADPYSFPADGFVERSNDVLERLPIVGGLATGLRGAGSTRLLLDGHVHERGAVGVVLGSTVAAAALVSQGCRPIGPAMTVTAADGNQILGLAGRPAIERLEEIVTDLPPEDQALVTRGLQIGLAMDEYAERHEQGDFLVRGVVGADRERGALVVGDLVEVGRTVRFQVRDAGERPRRPRRRARRLRSGSGLDAVDGALLFSCNGRGRALFRAPSTTSTRSNACCTPTGWPASSPRGDRSGSRPQPPARVHGVAARVRPARGRSALSVALGR